MLRAPILDPSSLVHLKNVMLKLSHMKRADVLVPVSPEARPPMPDFMARMKRIHGSSILATSSADLLTEGRERFWAHAPREVSCIFPARNQARLARLAGLIVNTQPVS